MRTGWPNLSVSSSKTISATGFSVHLASWRCPPPDRLAEYHTRHEFPTGRNLSCRRGVLAASALRTLGRVIGGNMARPAQLCVETLFIAAVAISALPPRAVFAQQAEAAAGLGLFLSTGCGACHRIAGTAAQGEIGPDLTHIASRATIGAKTLPMSAENLSDWIRRTQELKPGARMPSFGMLPVSETNAIVDYLVTLK